jgi:hypothetical protein
MIVANTKHDPTTPTSHHASRAEWRNGVMLLTNHTNSNDLTTKIFPRDNDTRAFIERISMRTITMTLLGLIAFLTLGAGLAAPAGAAQRTRCFSETGYCVSGAILDYWERNGGLPVFGYPIGDAHIETVEGTWTGIVQWFERDRLEDHGRDGVLAGRLGARYLELIGRPWETLPIATPNHSLPPCRYFGETHHSLCGVFLSYWVANGGLERFGYPISEPLDEIVEGRTYQVQYFERRRMEYHPENAGTAFEVLLGLLGRDVLTSESCPTISPLLRRTWATLAQDLGCGQPYGDGRLAAQPFERGTMIWTGRADGSPGQIFVLTTVPSVDLTWTMYIDTYVEGEPIGIDELPPPGKFAPVRGFRKLWRTVPEVRNALGWAISPEVADMGTVLQFSQAKGFSWMIHRSSADMVYILRIASPFNRAVDVPRQS